MTKQMGLIDVQESTQVQNVQRWRNPFLFSQNEADQFLRGKNKSDFVVVLIGCPRSLALLQSEADDQRENNSSFSGRKMEKNSLFAIKVSLRERAVLRHHHNFLRLVDNANLGGGYM